MVPISTVQLQMLAPNARSSYRDAFASADADLAAFGVNANSRRLRHFMAQILHECGGLSILYENMNYSAEGLVKTWPSRFRPRGPLDPAAFTRNPRMIGDSVYGGRMGNSNTNGYFFRGRGMVQTTGHDGYAEAMRLLQGRFPGLDIPDFVADPDGVLDPRWSLKVAAAEFEARGCNAIADADAGVDPSVEEASLVRITRLINGGVIGLASRRDWLRKTKRVWP